MRNRPLLYLLVPAIFISAVFSYYRFVVVENYLVSYEGECNPASENCFIGCEDEECTEEYYYTLMERRADDLHAQCGADITDCAAANACLPDETSCTVTYCSPDELGEGEECSEPDDFIDEEGVQEDTEISEENVGEGTGESVEEQYDVMPL